MLMIHIGVRRDELEVFEKQWVRFLGRVDVPPSIPITDHDSWEEWGEPTVGTFDMEKEAAVHVTIATMHPGRDIHFLANQFEEFLVPMMSKEEWSGLRIALTDASDCTQEYEEYRW